jgi:hypothetical protein
MSLKVLVLFAALLVAAQADAIAWMTVNYQGTVVYSTSAYSINVTHPATGKYCISSPDHDYFEDTAVALTLANNGHGIVTYSMQIDTACVTENYFVVYTYDANFNPEDFAFSAIVAFDPSTRSKGKK